MDLDDFSFTVLNEDGLEVTCDTLLMLYPEQGDADTFIIYTDYLLDENDDFNVYASKILFETEGFRLVDIDDINLIPKLQAAFEKVKEELN